MTARRRRRDPASPTYAIDTSTWIRLEQRPDLDDVWPLFLLLTDQKRLITAPEILRELKHPKHVDTSEICRRIRPIESKISFRRNRDQEFLNILGRLHFQFPQICKSRSRNRRPADPFVIATAKRCGFVVVCEETLDRRPSRKIPKACEALSIRCLTIDEMIVEEQLVGV
jgi:hypothetical protein